ncbi:Uncharacterised protein [Lelliottia amnigena]|nr:Uncharacterised protein [Lelliottia amnigena]
MTNFMKYHDLRDFLALLESRANSNASRFLLIPIWK